MVRASEEQAWRVRGELLSELEQGRAPRLGLVKAVRALPPAWSAWLLAEVWAGDGQWLRARAALDAVDPDSLPPAGRAEARLLKALSAALIQAGLGRELARAGLASCLSAWEGTCADLPADRVAFWVLRLMRGLAPAVAATALPAYWAGRIRQVIVEKAKLPSLSSEEARWMEVAQGHLDRAAGHTLAARRRWERVAGLSAHQPDDAGGAALLACAGLALLAPRLSSHSSVSPRWLMGDQAERCRREAASRGWSGIDHPALYGQEVLGWAIRQVGAESAVRGGHAPLLARMAARTTRELARDAAGLGRGWRLQRRRSVGLSDPGADEGGLAVEYLVNDERAFAVVHLPRREPVWVSLDAQAVTGAVSAWVRSRVPETGGELRPWGRQLDLLLPPLAAALLEPIIPVLLAYARAAGTPPHLQIVAGYPLLNLPWAALAAAQTGRIGLWLPVTVTPAGPQPTAEAHMKRSALYVGMHRNAGWFPGLPPYDSEVLETMVPQGRLRSLIDGEALPAAVASAARRAQLVHINAHGVYGASAASGLPALVLSSNDPAEPAYWTAPEIAEQVLEPGALVLLNSCHGGRGMGEPGAQATGLSLAFLEAAAGQAAVISGLWAIPVESSALFVSSFYQAWCGPAGVSAPEAFRQALLAVSNQYGDRLEHVAVWQYVGPDVGPFARRSHRR